MNEELRIPKHEPYNRAREKRAEFHAGLPCSELETQINILMEKYQFQNRDNARAVVQSTYCIQCQYGNECLY
jgi:hypothetical protein